MSSKSAALGKRLDFNPKMFNNIYWHLRAAFLNVSVRFIWAYGGSSASKTYSVVQLIIIEMLAHRSNTAMVLRKFGVDIKDSIYADFKSVVDKWELNHLFVFQEGLIKCKLTGAYTRFRGLDDAEKVKGIAGFKRVILEEISQFDEVDLKQIRKRLRGMIGQQIICLFNPISEDHWIKKNIFDKETLIQQPTNRYPICEKWLNEKGNTVILKTNYLDNKYIVGEWGLAVDGSGKLVQTGGFVDQHTIDDFEKDRIDDPNYYQIYGLGNWGKIRTGGEFWKDFDYNKWTIDTVWDEEKPLHITWDENSNPYITCLVWQVVGKTAVQIDEICLSDPHNKVRDACAEFRKRYPQPGVKGLFVYGDRTSIKEDTKEEKGENFYTKIGEYLSDYHPTFRLPTVNPNVVQSAGFINEAWRGAGEIAVYIDRKCKTSINDYQYALENSDGDGVDKTKVQHPVTKIRYEPYGHPSDAMRYLITIVFISEYTRYLTGKKGLKIRQGKSISKHQV